MNSNSSKTTDKSSERPKHSGRLSAGARAGRDLRGNGRSTVRTASLQPNEIGEQLLAQLPVRLQGDIQMLIDESAQTIESTRSFIRENPREAAGVAIGVGALIWGLLATVPGRRATQWGLTLAMPAITGWLAERFENSEGDGELSAGEEREEGRDVNSRSTSPSETDVAH